MREHIGERFGLAAAPGRHILQDWLFAEVEFDNVRHVAVNCLVVADTRADRICQRHIARFIGSEKARHAEH